MLLPKHNHILRTPTKKKTQRKNPKRSEIEKRKTLGHIMKFQNLKLEKERERERERNLRSKNDKVLRRKREYLRHGGLRTALTMGYDCLRVTIFVTMGYDFASTLGYDCLRVKE